MGTSSKSKRQHLASKTADGITENSTPKEVRHHHPQLASFVSPNSGAKVNGGRDLIYWIDRVSGIAFEFSYSAELKSHFVSKVIVFAPNSDFQPEGCGSPEDLHKLEPFSLEP